MISTRTHGIIDYVVGILLITGFCYLLGGWAMGLVY